MAPSPHWAEIGMLIFTVLLACVYLAALFYRYYFYRIQMDPDVIVYATNDRNLAQFQQDIILVIENIDKGLAIDVRFDLSEQMFLQAYGSNDPPPIMDYGPLIDGIPNLAPGQKRLIRWGHLRRIQKIIGDRGINVTCKFKSSHRIGAFYDREEYTNECVLEIRSFLSSPIYSPDTSAKSLEKIEKSLSKLSSIDQRIERLSDTAKRIEDIYSGGSVG